MGDDSGGNLLSSVGALGGGILGDIFSQGDQNNAQAAQLAALQAMQNVQAPNLAQQEVNLSQEGVQGQLTPQQEQTFLNNTNAYNNVATSPQLAAAQASALQQMGNLANGGMNATDMQNLMQIRNQSMGQANSMNAGVMSNLAQRGLAGGGAQLAAQLANNQNQANMAGQQSLGVASNAQQRALQALGSYGNMAQSQQAQQFGQQAQAAQAQNAINQFNTQNRQAVNNTNTQAQNAAQQYNLTNAQNVANQNASIQNQQKMYNSGLQQTDFQDAMQQAYGVAGQEQNNSNYWGNQASGIRQMGSQIGQGVGNVANAGYNSAAGSSGGSGSGSSGSSSGGDGSNYNLGSYNYGSAGAAPYYKGGEVEDVREADSAKDQIKQQESQLPHYDIGGMIENASRFAPLATMIMNQGGQVPDVRKADSFPNALAALIDHYANGGEVNGYSWGGVTGSGSPIGMTLMSHGGDVGQARNMKDGGHVEGKAKVKGDSPKNDTVHAMLSPGEIVIPRSIAKGSEEQILDFVKHILEKKNG